ncbi:hypothetical protein BS413_18460 [Cronobacter malonaticus]|nr:hypothetical protein BS413_18460 [Cronobacter malonaticus]
MAQVMSGAQAQTACLYPAKPKTMQRIDGFTTPAGGSAGAAGRCSYNIHLSESGLPALRAGAGGPAIGECALRGFRNESAATTAAGSDTRVSEQHIRFQ